MMPMDVTTILAIAEGLLRMAAAKGATPEQVAAARERGLASDADFDAWAAEHGFTRPADDPPPN